MSSAWILSLAFAVTGCSAQSGPKHATPTRADGPQCAPKLVRVAVAPDVEPHHQNPRWWFERPQFEPDRVLLAPDDAAALQATFAEDGRWEWRDPLRGDWSAHDADDVHRIRSTSYAARLGDGTLVEAEAGSFLRANEVIARASDVDEVRVVVEEASVHCVPLRAGLFKAPIDPDFDRNRCSSLHPGEVVRVLEHDAESQWSYVHTGYVGGWVHAASFTPRLTAQEISRLARATALVPLRDDVVTEQGFRLRLGTSLPITGRTDAGFAVLRPTPSGLREDSVAAGAPVHEGRPNLTRRTFFEMAFSELDAPYGWGGRAGERDCSRLLLDLFATFGIKLPRHSADQAQLGTHNVSVEGLPETQKREIIRQWAKRGIVVLFMPGHIMAYLGRDGDKDYAISAISEYLTPCGNGEERVWRLDRVAVTTLDLGRDTSRTSFIERITRIAVFAEQDTNHLQAASKR